ncbi:HET domain-containing protein [Microdochium nivale]|nr:HET domain-containing protein [Microdochium nivale]
MPRPIVTTAYTYRPLPTPTSIRVLVLEPALRDSQPLEVSLHECPIYYPAYEALSYTWGASTGTVPIICEGQTLLVTPNCASALVHLRNRFKSRQLWIDAICIDQNSVEEKNQQVPLMGKIYSLATRTVVWLGAGGPGDAGTLSRAKTVGKMVHFRAIPGFSALGEKQRTWARKLLSEGEVERIGRICQSDWFKRIWTVQEYLLAEHAVFMIGRNECPTSQLYTYFIIGEALLGSDSPSRRLFRLRSILIEDMAEARFANANPESESEDSEASDSEDNLQENPTAKSDRQHRRMMKQMDRKKAPKSHWYSNVSSISNRPPGGDLFHILSQILLMASMSEATDPRDKVYGISAFITSLHDDMEVPTVDYTRSIAETYEDFAVCMMRSTEGLWVLEHIVEPSREESWPS